jgi:hypothetical protein
MPPFFNGSDESKPYFSILAIHSTKTIYEKPLPCPVLNKQYVLAR